jgi:hypothetical protein
MKHYEDMTESDLLIDEFLAVVHTAKGQKRLDASGAVIRKINTVFARAEKAEKIIDGIWEYANDDPPDDYLVRTIAEYYKDKE